MNTENLQIDAIIDGFPVGISINNSIMENAELLTYPHFHHYFEIHFILAGQYKVGAGGKSIILYEGDVMIIPPEMTHCLTPVGESGEYERTDFGFDTGTLTNKHKASLILSIFFNAKDIIIINKKPDLANIMNEIYLEINKKKPYYIEFVKNEIIHIMILICRYIHETYDRQLSGQYSIKNIIISIESYINTNYGGECTLENLSEELHISRRQLSRLVYKYYSRSFRRLLYETRMSVANWLLEEKDISLSEIAEKTGYNTVSAFHHAYKNFYSVTPAEYKKNKNH